MTGTDDLEQLFRSLSRRHYEIAADERFGAQGTEALVRLVGTTRELLKHVAYEMLTDGLQVVVAVDPERPPQADGGAALRNLADLAGRAFSGLTVAILGTASIESGTQRRCASTPMARSWCTRTSTGSPRR